MMPAPTYEAKWTLGRLLDGIVAWPGADLPVDGLCSDSRRCAPGDLFLAWPGGRAHGVAHLPAAERAGAVAVLYDPRGAGSLPSTRLPLAPVDGLRALAGQIADRFFAEPSRAMTLIGVTGTNGKTSVCHFLGQALEGHGTRCGLVGTLGNGFPGALEPATHTTPDAIALHAELAGLRKAGASHAALEVSSHALDQDRVAGVRFDTAVFTNLTHEHLDYHGDMHGYAMAKRRLFSLPGLRHAALNVDDPQGAAWLEGLEPGIAALGYGFTRQAHVRGGELRLDADGLVMEIQFEGARETLRSPLLGRFNASNLLAALAALLSVGIGFGEAVSRLAGVRTVPGRMERFARANGALAVVDYAHTPDALAVALAALREHCRGRLWCVFGCGGDRDAAKRPLMGAVAARGADRVIVTDDNPRHEDGAKIVAEILAGVKDAGHVEAIRDRSKAISEALGRATPRDVVLIAGKGHETTQQVGDERIPFSDRALVRRMQEATG